MFKKTHLHVRYPFLVCIKFRLVHQSSGQLLINLSTKVTILRWSYQLRGLGGRILRSSGAGCGGGGLVSP